jgi:hypothetical protein
MSSWTAFRGTSRITRWRRQGVPQHVPAKGQLLPCPLGNSVERPLASVAVAALPVERAEDISAAPRVLAKSLQRLVRQRHLAGAASLWGALEMSPHRTTHQESPVSSPVVSISNSLTTKFDCCAYVAPGRTTKLTEHLPALSAVPAMDTVAPDAGGLLSARDAQLLVFQRRGVSGCPGP